MTAARQIAWRTTAPDYDFMRAWSLQHRVLDEGMRTLCGLTPRWMHEGAGDARRCPRCERIAIKRGYVDEYGEPILPQLP